MNRNAAAAILVLVLLGGCSGQERSGVRVTGGSPELGARAIKKYGCGSCHTIPGIKGATALVGPPLVHFSQRTFIAGELANSPDNLARWIEDPKGVEPKTAMPDLGVSAGEARNIAAYLLSLK